MKKIILSVALATAVLSSCSLNEEPIGTLTFTDSFESVADFERFRNGLYGDLRAIGTGFYICATELQMDMFNGVITNGNAFGQLANGNILSSDTDIQGVWGGLYGSINTSNLMIEKAETFIANHPDMSEEDLIALNRYTGEAKFNRAYMYFYLYQHFCQPYTAEKGDTPALGLPIVTIYHPTADRGSYPGRSTLNQTFALIEKDLQDCYDALKVYEDKVSKENITQNAIYLSTYVVDALRSRISLYKGEYAKCAEYANNLIEAGTWTLTNADNYKALWTSDTGTELIFVPFVDSDEAGSISATGAAWTSTSGDSADYIPSSDLVGYYETSDVRTKTFLDNYGLRVNGEVVNAPVFIKFPGNSSLNNGLTISGKNKPKMFRLSEMYLNRAEALCLQPNKDEAEANKLLNTIRRTRSLNSRFYKDSEYTGDELIRQIRRERLKELVGEGFRMFDLRRYNQGFTRSYLYTNETVEQILVGAGKTVEYIPGDTRYVWPIPTVEMNVNPQLAGQQNPGY